jgi:hypothetical protein
VVYEQWFRTYARRNVQRVLVLVAILFGLFGSLAAETGVARGDRGLAAALAPSWEVVLPAPTSGGPVQLGERASGDGGTGSAGWANRPGGQRSWPAPRDLAYATDAAAPCRPHAERLPYHSQAPPVRETYSVT